jgi:hypothetical protein
MEFEVKILWVSLVLLQCTLVYAIHKICADACAQRRKLGYFMAKNDDLAKKAGWRGIGQTHTNAHRCDCIFIDGDETERECLRPPDISRNAGRDANSHTNLGVKSHANRNTRFNFPDSKRNTNNKADQCYDPPCAFASDSLLPPIVL